MNIEFWTKSHCPKCQSTARVLDDRDVTITYRSFDNEPGLVDEAKALGFSEAPVVITPDDAWSGYRPDKLIGLPKLLGSSEARTRWCGPHVRMGVDYADTS